MKRLEDRIAIITGAASGQGKAMARLFAREGAIVLLTDINVEEGSKVEKEIKSVGEEAKFIKLDVTLSNDWEKLFLYVSQTYNKLDVLVNNAGISGRKTMIDATEEDWEKIHDVNAKSVFLGMKGAFELMKKNRKGSIINNSSIWGLVGSGTSAAYHAAKGAIRMLTKTAAVEFAPFGVRVNSIHPGIIRTPMTKDLLADSKRSEKIINNTPMQRVGKPEEVANAALFFASDESSFITGVELPVDGGYVAQ